MTITLTPEQFDELKARIARLQELAQFYAPHYAQADVTAAWTDVLTMLGAADEAARQPSWSEGQLAFEGWPV